MARCFLSLFCPDIGDRLPRLVEWCHRYSPLVSADGSDGVILDMTGCCHLFGGEEKLLPDLKRRLHLSGIASHCATAETHGAAWALARYSDTGTVHGEAALSKALDPLPVDALRLPQEVVLQLRRLGLGTIGTVRSLPRRSLSARFGSTILLRLDQAFQKAAEPLTPWRPPAAYRVPRFLPEPVSTTGSVAHILQMMLQELCAQLEKNHVGSRHLELACYRVDGSVDRCEVRTSKPTRSVAHLMRLFSSRLESLRARFGFEAFVLSVLVTEALTAAQLCLTGTSAVDDERSFPALVDRLGMKLGFKAVQRVRICESLLPEYAIEFPSAMDTSPDSAAWPEYRIRPIQLIDPPRCIQVSVLVPGESPVQLIVGGEKHRIVRSEGPERLTAEWWRDDRSRWKTRDYYRIEDERGARFWIFYESGRWFLHGQFP